MRGEPRIALGFQHREPPVPRPQWPTTQMANDTSPSRHRFVDSHCGLSACWSGCVSSPGTQHKTKASTAFPSRATFSPTYCPSSRARQLQSYKLPIVTCTAASVVQTAHRHVHGSFSRTNFPSSRARQLQSYKLPIVRCRVYSLPSSLSPAFFTSSLPSSLSVTSPSGLSVTEPLPLQHTVLVDKTARN